VIHSFRLALTDFEALLRAREYLSSVGVETHEREFKLPAGNYRTMRSLATGAGAAVRRIQELVAWPIGDPNKQWRKGFLAGIFDAEGSCGGAEAMRIVNKDSFIIHWTRTCLEHFASTRWSKAPTPTAVAPSASAAG